MSLVPLYGAIGLLLASLGVWVLLARPGHTLNRAFAALLLLFGGSGIVFQMMREATDPASALAYARAGSAYELPAAFLILVILDAMFLAKPRTRRRSVALGIAAAATGALLLALLALPLYEVEQVSGSLYFLRSDFLYLYAAALFLVEGSAVFLAARAVRSGERSPLQRRQAAMVGLAFALLVGHGGALSAATLVLQPEEGLRWPRSVINAVGIANLVVVAAAARPLSRPFQRGAGRALVLLLVLAVAAGVLDTIVRLRTFDPALADLPGTRVVWVGGFALAMSLAILRYDLAGVGMATRRRMAAGAGVLLGLGIAGIGAGAALALFGPTPVGIGSALMAMVSPVVLRWRPLRRVPARLTERLLVDPDDVDVVRERVRVYTSALQAALGPDGAVAPTHLPVLAALRAELSLTDRDHELLLSDTLGRAPREARPVVLLGRYVAERELGRGGTAVAYLARDTLLGREVVLKRLTGLADHAAAFLAEARALARLEHPRVIRLFEARQVGHEVFLVLEYAAGGSLQDRLDRGPLPLGEAMPIILDLLEGLEVVHAAGMVHGDVKPSNVLLTREGRAKLADLGGARVVRAADQTARVPPAMGTLSAMAPEQVLGEALSPRTDVYAVGALLYRVLTGQPYIELEASGEREVRGRILHAPPRLPHPRIPRALEPVLRQALEKDPRLRPADVPALRAALQAATAPLTSP